MFSYLLFKKRLCSPGRFRTHQLLTGDRRENACSAWRFRSQRLRSPISHHEGNGSAAAWSTLPSFANLPRYTAIIKDLTDFLDEFAVGVIAAGFTAEPPCIWSRQGHSRREKNYLSPLLQEHGIKAAIESPESISLFSMVS